MKIISLMGKIKVLDWILYALMGSGLCTAVYYAYQLYEEGSVVENAPEETRSLVSDWEDLKPKNEFKVPPRTQGEGEVPGLCEYTGSIYIPRIGKKMPYVLGTDPDCLKKGLGLFLTSELVYPGELGRCIISGHRDTHFRKARLLHEGDRFLITSKMAPNQLFVYQYRTTRIVDKKDTSVAVSSDQPELCLTTCYPFGYIGNAPKRYVMCGPLIEVINLPPEKWKQLTTEG